MSYLEITSQLSTASNALQAGNTETLDQSLEQLTDAYDTVKMAERARVARLQAARTESDLTAEQQSSISKYEQGFMATYFGRGGFIAGAEMFLIDPVEADASELATQASELRNREKQLQKATREVTNVLDTASVPARLGVLSFTAVDSSPTFRANAEVELHVENVGDEAAEEVAATASAPVLEESSTTSLGSLNAGSRETVTFSFPISDEGDIEVSVSVESANAGSASETTTITVRTKQGIVKSAKNELGELKNRIESTVDHPGLSRRITSKLDAAIRSLKRALSAIESGNAKKANQAMNTTTNQLGALLNSVHGENSNPGNGNGGKSSNNNPGNGHGGKPALPEASEKALINRTELVIDQLSDAQQIPLTA